ncbi:MAG: DUF2167 domain-containing protein [Bacteroidota bacterium]
MAGGFPFVLTAQDDTTLEMDTAVMFAAYRAYTDSIEQRLTFYSDTTVTLGDGLASLDIPAGYTFVDGDDARTVLVDLWGNPPTAGMGSLGMLFPAKHRPSDEGGYGIDIFFTEDGYIDDEDAADMDFDDILEGMREGVAEDNEYRRAEGYQTMELVGWATPPRYDLANKRLHWAKELHFDGEEANTLNYNILFLGRRGYLTMNVIGGMEDLAEVNTDLDDFLGSVAYNEGHRYMDFDPSMDEVAAYGVGALIAGKVLAKTGLLAGIGIFLAKAWKLIAIAAVAFAGGLKKVLNSGK